MPNWCSNELTVSAPTREEVDAFIARAASGDHVFVGPFAQKAFNEEKEFDWGTFTPIYMEMLMRDDELFMDKRDDKPVLSFHAFVPMPREVMLAPYDSNRLKKAKVEYPEWFDRFPKIVAGYDWEHQNWGVKWGACEASIGEVYQDGEGRWCVDYSFDTAWGPPEDFYYQVGKMYPTMNFYATYREEGMGFQGTLRMEGGECTESDQWETEREDEEEDGDDDGGEE